MGIVRGIVKGISGFLFTALLLITILLLGLTKFTQYESLKPVITDIISEQVSIQINETQLHSYLNLYCEAGNETVKLNFTIVEIEISCQEIMDKTPNQLIEIFSSKTFDTIYYKEYECEFIDCLRGATKREEYLVVLSERSNSFLKNAFLYSLYATAFFLLIFLLACKNWYSRARDLGITLVFVGFPYFVLDIILSKIFQQFLPPEAIEVATPAVDALFTHFRQSFFLLLVSGGVLLIIALAIKLRSRK